MNASPAQILALENYKAHLQSVKAELDSVSTNLADVLKEKDITEKEVAVITEELDSLQKQRDVLQSANAALSETIREKSRKERDIDQAILEKEAQFDREESARKKAAQDFLTACASLAEHKSKMEAEAKSAEAHRDLVKNFLDAANEEHTRVLNDIQDAKDRRQKYLDAHLTLTAELQREIRTLEAYILTLQEKHIEEQKNAGSTDRVLAEREERITNAEYNIQVIQNRINRIWTEYFPTVTPPNL